MAQGRKRLERQFRRSLEGKQDKPNLVPALLGAYVNGQKTLKVANREDFVWCRIRGSTSEVVQAFNETVGLHWDLPILIYRDPNFEGMWKVYGRDITQYEEWEGVNYLPHHGSQHSFRGGQGSGSDPVWVYKRQFMPFLPRPIASGDMSIFIEQDLYYWDGEFHWWGGSGTEDLTSYKPTGSVSGKFLTVYIEGSTETLKLLEGDEFNLVFAPDNPTEYIPVPAASQGIPIASVMLQTGTTSIGWHEIFDLRLAPSMFPTTGTQMGIYDEHLFQGGVSNLDFIGDQVQAVVSGSYAFIEVTAAAPGDDQIGVYNTDDGQPLGTGTRIDWGDNLDVSISGTTVHVDGQAGGGGGGSGSVIVLDDGSLLGSAEKLDFIGAGVSAVLNAETAEITIPGGGGGGSSEGGSGSTYVRAGEANPLDGATGVYWQVPDQGYATGTLSVAVNGIWQTPVTSYTEQHPSSGTFELDERPATGSIVSAAWGVHAGVGHATGTMVIYDDDTFVGVFEEMRMRGSGVTVENSGSYASMEFSGGGGGHSTGTMVVYDEHSFLGVFEEIRFIGSGVQVQNSGTYAAVEVSGGGGGAISDWETEVNADSPVAWLRLGESSGTTASDETGNGNDGSYNGSPTLGVAGAIVDDADTAVSLDGSNDYIEWDAVADELAGLSEWTIEGWFKPDNYSKSSDGFGQVLFALNDSSGGNIWFIRLHVDTSNNNVQGALLLDNVNSIFRPMSTDIWHHVVLVQKDGLLVVYVDGVPAITRFDATDMEFGATDQFSVGQEWDGGSTSDHLAADVDEVLAYTSALDPDRVQAHFRAGRGI